MNNLRLLAGWLVALLPGAGVCLCENPPRVVTLEEIFETAELNSVSLRPSLTAEEVAKREMEVARNRRLPDTDASLSLSYIGNGFTTGRNFTDLHKAPIPHFGNSLSLNVNQPVYAGGAITKGIELSELKLTSARLATELNRDNLRIALTGFYLDLYKYHNLREVTVGNIASAEKLLSIMRARLDQGVALKNDVTRYELLVSNLNLQLTKIDNMLTILNQNIAVTAGYPDDTKIIPDSTILDRAMPLESQSWWLKETEENSSAIRLADSRIDINRKAEELVKSERLPKIGLLASWSFEGPILTEVPPINRNLSYWFVGVGVSYSLSSLYKTDKQLRKSQAATQLAIQQSDAVREETLLAVRNDYIKYMEAFEELETQTKSMELADSNYRTVETRFKEGKALITDMLDAANSRLEAERNLINSRINIIYYHYKLLFSSGKI